MQHLADRADTSAGGPHPPMAALFYVGEGRELREVVVGEKGSASYLDSTHRRTF
jgi:hypothetical protein